MEGRKKGRKEDRKAKKKKIEEGKDEESHELKKSAFPSSLPSFFVKRVELKLVYPAQNGKSLSRIILQSKASILKPVIPC